GRDRRSHPNRELAGPAPRGRGGEGDERAGVPSRHGPGRSTGAADSGAHGVRVRRDRGGQGRLRVRPRRVPLQSHRYRPWRPRLRPLRLRDGMRDTYRPPGRGRLHDRRAQGELSPPHQHADRARRVRGEDHPRRGTHSHRGGEAPGRGRQALRPRHDYLYDPAWWRGRRSPQGRGSRRRRGSRL
ncbi:MAG: Thioesterase, partial [uncultured Rubrobacteraceae bacterium]